MATSKSNDSAALGELGIDPALPPAELLAALRGLRSAGAAPVASIARALGSIPSAGAASLLAEMEHGASGHDRREIRRALFKLSQRGIRPPDEPAVSTRTDDDLADAGLSAVLSPIDGDGARIVWILKTQQGGGLRRLWGVVSEREGLVGISVDAVTRKELRNERKDVEKRAGVALIDADWRLADFILNEAWRATPDTRRHDIGDFLGVRYELIGSAPPTTFHHPIYTEFVTSLNDDPSLELMQQPEIAAWQLPAELIKPYANEVADLRNSVIVLSRPQQEERVNQVIERATTELLGGAPGERLRRHIEDTAYYFARTKRPREAAMAAAAASKTRDHADLRRIPFFQTFMRAQLGALISEKQEHERDEPRLIMTPAEAMRARQQAMERRRGLSR
jgi:hypothetical protein